MRVLLMLNSLLIFMIYYIFRRKVKSIILNKLYSFMCKFPLNGKKIIFESFGGKSYSDNPKYIYKELIRLKPEFKCVWVVEDLNTEIEGVYKKIKKGSLQYLYHYATSKYWISNARIPTFLKKREKTVYLQTWHGTPLKKLGLDMDIAYFATPNYKKNFYFQSRRWDYLISQNKYSSEIFKSAFATEKDKILELGYPRNDILKGVTLEESIKNKLNIPKDKKIILYAPTWRDDSKIKDGNYKFDVKLDFEKLQQELGKEYIIILRMHYLISDNLKIDKYKDFVYNMSKYSDISELYLISDILITDYSSVMFDYANLERPILFYTYDIDNYRDNLRGFYIDFENEAPGPLIKTQSELLKALKNIKQIELNYSKKYSEFSKKYCYLDQGNVSKEVVNFIFKN